MKLKSLVSKLALTTGLLYLFGVSQAQTIQTGVDATFAPHAMPKLGGGYEEEDVSIFDIVCSYNFLLIGIFIICPAA